MVIMTDEVVDWKLGDIVEGGSRTNERGEWQPTTFVVVRQATRAMYLQWVKSQGASKLVNKQAIRRPGVTFWQVEEEEAG